MMESTVPVGYKVALMKKPVGAKTAAEAATTNQEQKGLTKPEVEEDEVEEELVEEEAQEEDEEEDPQAEEPEEEQEEEAEEEEDEY